MTLEYTSNFDYELLLAQRIRSYRLEARMSQKELSEQSGVSVSVISKFEQGKNVNMTIDNLISILRAFGMEDRICDILPELPISMESLEKLNKIIPRQKKRVSHVR